MQQEIFKAQEVVQSIDEQRARAEQNVFKYRGMVRKFRDEKIIYMAMQEGKRVGYAEGMEAGTTGFTNHIRTNWDGRELSDDEDLTDTEELYISRQERRRQETDRPPSVASEMSNQTHQSAVPMPHPPSRPPSRPQSAPRPASPNPRPIPPQSSGPIHPTIIHNSVLSPSQSHVDIPPEGYIPQLEDGKILMPPPHGLSRTPLTPEPPMSPPMLPPLSQFPPPETPGPRARSDSGRSIKSYRSHRSNKPRKSHRVPSPTESNDSSIAGHPLMQGPSSAGAYSPMSVIPEARSNEQSPEDRATPRAPPSSFWVRSILYDCCFMLTLSRVHQRKKITEPHRRNLSDKCRWNVTSMRSCLLLPQLPLLPLLRLSLGLLR